MGVYTDDTATGPGKVGRMKSKKARYSETDRQGDGNAFKVMTCESECLYSRNLALLF